MTGFLAIQGGAVTLITLMLDLTTGVVPLLGTITLDPPGRHTATEIVITISLLSLMTQKELFRAYGGENANRSMRLLNIAIVPLLILFTAFIGLRLLNLLHIL